MTGVCTRTDKAQRHIEPARRLGKGATRPQESQLLQAAALQVTDQPCVSRKGLGAADLLALQRVVGNVRTQQVTEMIGRQESRRAVTGHALIGAAAETPVKSSGEYGDLILKMLMEDKERKLSIQEVVRSAAEAKSIGIAAPTTAEAGDARPLGKVRRRIALILSNAKYQKPSEDLPRTDSDGAAMLAELKTRGYKTNWLKNLSATKMVGAFKGFLDGAKAGDDAVIFYSGHGDVEGMQGVDNGFVSPQIVAGWKDQALVKGYELTVIIEACHAGSTTDFIRKEESVRVTKIGEASGKDKVVTLAEIAEQLQQTKDELARLERAKQALLEDPLVGRLQKTGALENEIERKDKEIGAAWKSAMPKISELAKQVEAATREKLAVPTFGSEPEWLNTKQLDQLDTMTNRTLELARDTIGR